MSELHVQQSFGCHICGCTFIDEECLRQHLEPLPARAPAPAVAATTPGAALPPQPPRPFRLTVGRNLGRVIDPQRGSGLMQRIAGLRKSLLEQTGVNLPAFLLSEDARLGASEWSLHYWDQTMCTSVVPPAAQDKLRLPNPCAGLPACHAILKDLRLCLHGQVAEVFTFNHFETELERIAQREPHLVARVRSQLDPVMVWQALRLMLREQLPLTRLSALLETLLVQHSSGQPLHPEQLVSGPLLKVALLG